MKSKLFLIALLFVGWQASVYSQLGQGTFKVGGEFTVSSAQEKTKSNNNTSDGPTSTSFVVMPELEYFLAENFSAGLGIGYSFDKATTTSGSTEYTSKRGLFHLNPYVRKYFPLGNQVAFYGQAGLGFAAGTTKHETKVGSTTTTTETNSSSLSLGITPGIILNLSEKISIEAGLGFVGYTSDVEKSGSGNNEVKDITNRITFSVAPSYITFGLKYALK